LRDPTTHGKNGLSIDGKAGKGWGVTAKRYGNQGEDLIKKVKKGSLGGARKEKISVRAPLSRGTKKIRNFKEAKTTERCRKTKKTKEQARAEALLLVKGGIFFGKWRQRCSRKEKKISRSP